MKGDELKRIRYRLRLTKFKFGRLLGYTSKRLATISQVHSMERGRKPIPLYIARLAWLIHRFYEIDGETIPLLPDWDYEIANEPGESDAGDDEA